MEWGAECWGNTGQGGVLRADGGWARWTPGKGRAGEDSRGLRAPGVQDEELCGSRCLGFLCQWGLGLEQRGQDSGLGRVCGQVWAVRPAGQVRAGRVESLVLQTSSLV